MDATPWETENAILLMLRYQWCSNQGVTLCSNLSFTNRGWLSLWWVRKAGPVGSINLARYLRDMKFWWHWRWIRYWVFKDNLLQIYSDSCICPNDHLAGQQIESMWENLVRLLHNVHTCISCFPFWHLPQLDLNLTSRDHLWNLAFVIKHSLDTNDSFRIWHINCTTFSQSQILTDGYNTHWQSND